MKSVNPATGEVLRTFEPHDPAEVERRVQAAASAFGPWSARTFDERAHVLWRCGVLLRERAKDLGALMTSEMGKPLDQAVAEVTKCAMACDHYAEHAASLLAMEAVNSKAPATRIAYEPLGVILSIMPWNFPFWQVWRFAAPALMAGNTVLVKHAPNVLGCSEAIVQLAGQVVGNQAALAFTTAQAYGQLALTRPHVGFLLLWSSALLADGCRSLADHCIAGLEPNRDTITEHVGRSLMLVTALTPHIGYDAAARIAKHAHANGLTLRQAALALELVEPDDFDAWVRAEAMV